MMKKYQSWEEVELESEVISSERKKQRKLTKEIILMAQEAEADEAQTKLPAS